MKGSRTGLIASSIGFVIAFICCLPFAHWKESPEVRRIQHEQSSRIRPVRQASFLEDLQTSSTSAHVKPNELLALAHRAGFLSEDERTEALTHLLALSKDERQTPLAILLLRWADTAPEEAILWSNKHLEGIERKSLLKDLATTWAHQDAMGLATWWEENMPDEVLFNSEKIVMGVLSRCDPLACASYMDLPRLHKISVYGVIENGTILDPADLPRYAKAIVGKTGYKADQSASSSALPGKSGWNELFEKVAVTWHRKSPKDCEAWLKQFPKHAQTVAKRRIQRTER